jgi:dimethlysulfoniopropionate lyase
MHRNRALERCLAAIAGRLPPGEFADAVHALRAGGLPEFAPAENGALPVLRYWPRALADAGVVDAELAQALMELTPALRWRQNPNYVRRPPGPAFLDGYGYAVIAGPGGLVPAGTALGVLLLAPGILYPAHSHPAEEVYLVMDGESRWWREGGDWRLGIAGAVVHHPPHLPHAMQAGPAAPLCAIYAWRGDLATNAALTGSALTET